MSCYTFDDYRDMLFSGVCVKLDDTTEDKIDVLSSEINSYVKTQIVLQTKTTNTKIAVKFVTDTLQMMD